MHHRKGRVRLIDENGLRVDGRKVDEIRPIKIEVGILDKADGSAYIEQGRNRIMVAVYGPREVHPKHMALVDRAILRCRYHMAPFSTEERKSPAPSRREMELSKVIREALEPSVLSEQFPRTSIDIFIEVLQSDGGTRCAGIAAASVALSDAGIPLKELVASIAVGKAEGQLIIDPSDVEDQYGEGDMPIAYLPKSNSISLLQMDGVFTRDEVERALRMGIEACNYIHQVQKEALKRKYLTIREQVEEREEPA